MKLKAVMIEDAYHMRIAEVERPVINSPQEVLIRVTCGGICGSDIGIYRHTNSLASYPRIIGHEYGGRVEEIGSAVTGLLPGDMVAVDPVRRCGGCYACTHGRSNVCKNVEVTGVHRDGGFAQYVVAPADCVYRIDTRRVPAEYLCLVEPYSIGSQVNHRARITAGDRVLIMGSGPIGNCVMQIAKAKGAWVMMTDILDSRLDRAREMGADLAVNVQNRDLAEAVLDCTDGEGMPVVVDAVCSARSFERALELACPAGRVVTLGLADTPSAVAEVAITKKELDVIGSRLNNRRFPEVIRLFEEGKVTPGQLRTHTFPFAQAEEAFRLIMEHPEQVCKVTLSFEN